MSITLGEKLRQAREARGFSISEVAEQTRISALYLECIENDDYRTLPGGIFNKGFVKSFAKTVGVDEQEALQDYASLINSQGGSVNEIPKTYRSEVLTDERNSATSFSTLIAAAVILGLIVAGGFLFVRYYNSREAAAPVAAVNANAGGNANAANVAAANTNSAPVSGAPTMDNLKVEFKALKSPVALSSTTDGVKLNANVTPENPRRLEPKQSVRFSYSKSQSANVELTLNGKTITLPTTNGTRNVIEFEINGENLRQIYDSGQVTIAAASR